ncbi:MAG: YfhO family protein [Tenuifilum sp.]|uniref:YfhO family protein n=1 Tax=Tenuifilum sp. TaxID=2760880 RepID=UPI002BA0BE46|nr:YfhO family protein [Tenuifilum sp.]HOK85564.1 YfhO family protein [Tenuifilum sp.]HON70469.1 YfhO family protein [Tenuifilum sp.]HOU75024.1 YfhO family protein [Tenuifilum sp.]HQG72738.1 YfhO family protein [Tenuifilum sp.]
MNSKFSKIKPHIVALLLFMAIPLAYFYPQLQGKRLAQHDIAMWKGSAKEILDYKAKTGEESLWTNSMFGGMPAYLISANYKGNLLKHVDSFLNVVGRPASYIFLTMLGFYILLLVFGVNPWLAIVGSIAYGLSTYFLIVIGAGHNAKIHAIAYVAPTIAGMILALRGQLFAGLAVFGLAFGLNLNAGHPQITYYGALVMASVYLYYFVEAFKAKALRMFTKATGILLLAAVLAFGANFTYLWFTNDYGKDTIRGKSELTHDRDNRTSGLDKDYATQWSYGIAETFNLLIPNLMGGSSTMDVGEKSETFRFLRQNGVPYGQASSIAQNLPTYWGPQPSTSGPVYLGAIVVFLFVFGMFILKGRFKWFLFGITVLAIMLSWGKNFNFLTDLFLNYFPFYNKFRTVSMILVIVELTIPLLGILALKEIVDGKVTKDDFWKSFKWSVGLVGGICLLFLLLGKGMLSFSGSIDNQLGWPKEIVEVMRKDRQALMWNDAFRSLFFVLAGAVTIALYYMKKLKPTLFFALLGLLITVDLWVVNKRFMDNKNFELPQQVEAPFTPTDADKQILADNDPNFRVFNLTVSPFNDASTSYFHKSIGGYHGAKLRRYQDLIDFHLSKGNIAVFNMLNTKYIIQPGKEGPVAVYNPDALGHAWFVDSVKVVNIADEEIEALNGFNPKSIAVVDKRFEQYLRGFEQGKSGQGKIELTEYRPNRLKYRSDSPVSQLAVFSEIYYPKGWQAYLDGTPADHFRVNYVLRAMQIPAGNHEIEFVFDPPMWKKGMYIDLASSLLLILTFVGWVSFSLYKTFKE